MIFPLSFFGVFVFLCDVMGDFQSSLVFFLWFPFLSFFVVRYDGLEISNRSFLPSLPFFPCVYIKEKKLRLYLYSPLFEIYTYIYISQPFFLDSLFVSYRIH